MTRDDIIRMAHEAGWSGVFVIEWAKQPDKHPVEKSLPVPVTMEQIERFAALVAAAEREARAKVCGSLDETDMISRYDYRRGVLDCADAIRARGKE